MVANDTMTPKAAGTTASASAEASKATIRRVAWLIGAACGCWIASAATHALVLSIFVGRPVDLHVRWSPATTDVDRLERERRFHLTDGALREGTTYDYTLLDVSPANIEALVSDSAVEDTTNIDRATFQIMPGVRRHLWANEWPWVPTGLDILTIALAVAGGLGLAGALLEWWQHSSGRSSSIARTYRGAADVAVRLGPAIFVFAAVAVVFVLASMWGHDFYSDEDCHFSQVQIAWQHEWEQDGCLTTLPGYHVAAATVGRSLGLPVTVDAVRLVTAVASAVMFGLFALSATAVGSAPSLKVAQLVALPILLPYTALVFTDAAALLGLVLASCFAIRGRSLGAALSLTLTLLVRQTHIVWGALLVGMCWQARGLWPESHGQWSNKEHGTGKAELTGWADVGAWQRRIRSAWPFAIPLLAFGAFVAWNGGVAIGDADVHQAGLYSGNPIFASLLLAMFFAPQALASAWRQRWSPPAWVLAIAAALLVVVLFKVTHPYNQVSLDNYFRNRMVLWFASGTGPRVVLAVGVALGVVALWGARVRLKWLLLGTAALSMLPSELIEHRYAIPAFAFFILLREPEEPWLEGTSLALMTAIALILVHGISAQLFKL